MARAHTILVVDDDRDLLELIDVVLQREGYLVATATSGRDALEAVAQAMPDLILLDLKMPVMDGWEFARTFHARYAATPPIVVFTAADVDQDCVAEIGAAGSLSKPFELDELLATVNRWVGGSHPG